MVFWAAAVRLTARVKARSVLMVRKLSPRGIHRDDGGSAVAALRRTVRDGDADLVERALQNVGAMAGGVHPAVHDGGASEPDGKVLADEPVAIAALLRPDERLDAVRRDVGEVVLGEHVADAVVCSEGETVVQAEGPEAALGALAVHGVEDGQAGVGFAGRHARGPL